MTTKKIWQTAWNQLRHATIPPPPTYAFSITNIASTSSFHPFAAYFHSPRLYGRNTQFLKKSPRYVLSRGFASGLFAWSLPCKASETAAVVSSCSGGSTVDRIGNVNGRKLRERRQLLYPLAKSVWRRGVCTDCRNSGLHRGGRRSSSSKSNGKFSGNGRPPKRDKGGDKDYSKNGRSVQSGKQEYDKGKGKSKEYEKGKGKFLESKDAEESAREISEAKAKDRSDKQKSTSLAAAAAAIAKRAARDHGFMERLPQIHRPSKDELLAAASSFWDRLRIRFKWLTIRQIRPFNTDEITAFFSWILLGNLAWIVLGTTTFFSITIWLVNTVFAQETLAKAVGNYLTQEMGMKVVFESAIVPRWRDGCISFKKVFISRRPGILKGTSVEKGSSTVAAAVAAAAAFSEDHSGATDEEDDGNYTQFDLTVDTVNVTISLAKWMNGRGLLVDVDMKGVRGVVDRTHLVFDPAVDPRSYKHQHTPGDFELDHFKLEDLLVTVYQPNGFRPFHISIFTCDLPQLRKRWLFYDFLSASNISGSYDDSLFTLHPRQSHGPVNQLSGQVESQDGTIYPWKRTSRFRIDNLNFDHLNRGYEGPLSWIVSGNVDLIADIHFPEDSAEGISKFMHDMMEKMENSITARREKLTNMMSSPELSYEGISGLIGAAVGLTEDENTVANALIVDDDGSYTSGILQQDNLPTIEESINPQRSQSGSLKSPATVKHADHMSNDKKFMMIDLHLEMNDTRAAIPLFTQDLSYKNNALMRPIIAYINSQRTIIPINCRLLKRAQEFDGSWTLFDSGLMDDLSAEVYDAFIRDIADEDIKKRRIRAVGLWSLQVFMNAFLAAMAGTMIA